MRSLISAFVIRSIESTCAISKLATSEISIFKLVSVAEQAGLSLTWSETPKTNFSRVEANTVLKFFKEHLQFS